jgi:hypothetical protein
MVDEQEQQAATSGQIERGDFLKWAGLLGLTPALAEALFQRQETAYAAETKSAAAATTSTSTFTPVRPPATPLVVRAPYVNTWQFGDNLAGQWPKFWNGVIKAIAGIIRVDGAPYVFMGDPRVDGNPIQLVTQKDLTVTPTQSIYTLQAGPVTLTLTFLSPVEANDLRRLSMPLSYISARAHSNDGAAHQVSLYVDISGEWAHPNTGALIKWDRQQAATMRGSLTALTVTAANPTILAEKFDDNNLYSEYPSWGVATLAAQDAPNVTFQIAADTVARSNAVSGGRLDNTIDADMPRAINDRFPVLAFNSDLGAVGAQPTSPFTLIIGHIREPAVNYLGRPLPPLWRAYWPRWQSMVSFAFDDATSARGRANTLDAKIESDAMAAGGANYYALCALALRQAFAGTELVQSPSGAPWIYLKEISSDGNVSTVDVTYPGCPAFLYMNPRLMKPLLDPIFDNCERPVSRGGWPKKFAIHDIGSHYPNATGHPDGDEEDMPVEESANMLIMTASYLLRVSRSEASAYATQHYKILRQWATYLTSDNGSGSGNSNALDPLFQNQTDDFSGFIGHSVNLALKGILGVGAMSVIAGFAGQTTDQQTYGALARQYIQQWADMAQDPSQAHLMLTYTEGAQGGNGATNGAGTWSLKYNAYPDKLLGLNLLSGLKPNPAGGDPNDEPVLQEEAAWYKTQEDTYGIALDSRHTVAPGNQGTYTKGDWELWTAASTDDATLRGDIVRLLYAFLNNTPSRVPFTDFYNQHTAQQAGFQARPVVGAMFAILTLTAGTVSGPVAPTPSADKVGRTARR